MNENKTMNVFQKIIEIKKIAKSFYRDATPKGLTYTYVTGSQILAKITDKMNEIGLILLPKKMTPQPYQTHAYTNAKGFDKCDFIVQGEMAYEWINAENPEDRYEVTWAYYGQQDEVSKAFGSGLTYSERYFLLKSLGLPTDDEDPDAKGKDDDHTYAGGSTKQNDKDTRPKGKSHFMTIMDAAKAVGQDIATVNKWIMKKYGKVIQINELDDTQYGELLDALTSAEPKP